MSASINDLICPHIDKERAQKFAALYFCDSDEMPFDSMYAHCRYCPEYDKIYAKAVELLGREWNFWEGE